MLYTIMTRRAMRICFKAHKEQRDKGGVPYVFHPFHVAEQMHTEEEICVALLHDVMEDNKAWSRERLAREGFPPAVLDALDLLTHKKNKDKDEKEDYMDYVARLRDNPIAAAVKLADLRHNSTPGRLPVLKEKDRERLKKYLEAQALLTGGEADLENMCLRLEMPEETGQRVLNNAAETGKKSMNGAAETGKKGMNGAGKTAGETADVKMNSAEDGSDLQEDGSGKKYGAETTGAKKTSAADRADLQEEEGRRGRILVLNPDGTIRGIE